MAIVKEWLDGVSFKEIVPFLVKKDSMAKGHLTDYKMAFDRLCAMAPAEDDGVVVNIEITDYDDGTGTWLSMHEESAEKWAIELARQVVVADDAAVGREEIVAEMLWELTYWGFCDEDMDNTFERLHNGYRPAREANPYKDAFLRLRQRNHGLNCRYKEDVGKDTVTIKNIRQDLLWEPRRNGPKRHRERRQTARLEALEKMMNRWELAANVADKHNLDNTIGANLRKDILESGFTLHERFMAVCPARDTAAYLSDLLSNYYAPPKDAKEYDHAWIFVSHNKDADIDAISSVLKRHFGIARILFDLNESIEYTNIDTLLIFR